MEKILAILVVLAASQVWAQAPARYAQVVVSATNAPGLVPGRTQKGLDPSTMLPTDVQTVRQGLIPVAKCQVVNIVLWNGVTPYAPPDFGQPAVATKLIPDTGVKIGDIIPNC